MHQIICVEGHEAFNLRDKFPQDIGDIDYFSELGIDWIVISKDLNNARKKAERAAIMQHKVVAIYLAKNVQKQKINEQTATILWQWEKMLSQRLNNENGLFVLPISKGSKFRSL